MNGDERVKERVFAYGFPRLYGGANTEMYHQVILWLRMGYEVHLIADADDYKAERLYVEMLARGVVIHGKNEWDVLRGDDVVVSFCNLAFLLNLREIVKRTRRTVYVNCMRSLSPLEMNCVRDGLIAMSLYQNEEVYRHNGGMLKSIGKGAHTVFRMFTPYFEASQFPMREEDGRDFFGCGRISRNDARKFSRNTLAIYERFSSPLPKRGLFLGFGNEAREKVGAPPTWIRTTDDPFEILQREFYRHCDVVLQPSTIVENWPRIGFEAMSSGSVLIVDNIGGWKQMVEHGKTGWLCDSPHDFVHYATQMAHEPQMRRDMALAARARAELLGGYETASESWREIFEQARLVK